MKQQELLKSLADYCSDHPDMRFWQALRSWSGFNFVLVSNAPEGPVSDGLSDTFFWQHKDH